MSSTEEILADPASAVELPHGAVPTHVVVLVEYANPGSTDRPSLMRIGCITDEDAGSHTVIGMLQFALQRELSAVADAEADEDE